MRFQCLKFKYNSFFVHSRKRLTKFPDKRPKKKLCSKQCLWDKFNKIFHKFILKQNYLNTITGLVALMTLKNF